MNCQQVQKSLKLGSKRYRFIEALTSKSKGGKVGLFGGAGVGKTVLIQESIHNIASGYNKFQYLMVLASDAVMTSGYEI